MRAHRGHGGSGLEARPATGRPRRLAARQGPRLLRELLGRALAHGYGSDLWTTKRIAEVIEREFDVCYHRAHVSRLLALNDRSPQKPELLARERDDAAIASCR
jgi:transposase